MAASHPNAAISDTFGDASDAVKPTSALVIPAVSRALPASCPPTPGMLPCWPWGGRQRCVAPSWLASIGRRSAGVPAICVSTSTRRYAVHAARPGRPRLSPRLAGGRKRVNSKVRVPIRDRGSRLPNSIYGLRAGS